MKRIRLRTFFFLCIGLLVLVIPPLLWITVRAVNAKINNPEFKTRIETKMAAATNTTIRVGTLSGRVGLHPWFKATGVQIAFPLGNIRVDMDEIRIYPALRPLFRGEVVLSEIHLMSPAIVVRRPRNGAWPTAAAFPRNTATSHSLLVDKIVMQDARFTAIDENRSLAPVLELRTDAELTTLSPSNERVLTVEGEGRSGMIAPLRFQAVCASSGPVAVAMQWRSSTTVADMTLSTDDWSKRDIRAELTASKWNVDEIRRIFGPYRDTAPPRVPSATIATSSWTVHARMDIAHLHHGIWRVPRVQAEAVIGPRSGEVPMLRLHVFRGVIAGSGKWKTSFRTGLLVDTDLTGTHVQMEDMLAPLAASSVTWSGAFGFRVRLHDAPLPNFSSYGLNAALVSVARSRDAAIDITSDVATKGSTVFRSIKGHLGLDATQQRFVYDVRVDWGQGRFAFGGSFPHLKSAQPAPPLTAHFSVDNFDVVTLPQFAKRFDITRALVSAKIRWQSSMRHREKFDLFFKDSRWAMDLTLHDVQWRTIPITDTRGHFVWDGTEFRVEQIQGRVSSGTVSADVSFRDRTPTGFQSFATTQTVRDMEVGPVFFAFSTNPVILSGRFSSDATVSGSCVLGQTNRLQGRFAITGRTGYIRSGSVLFDVLTNINLGSLFHTADATRHKGLPFDVISATAAIADGKMMFSDPVLVKGPALEMAYTGWINANFDSGYGMLVINPLVGSRNLIGAIPVVSQLVIGPNGEFLPLIVDLSFRPGKIDKKFRSIQTLTGPAVRIVGNLLRLPMRWFGGAKKKTTQ